MHCEIINAVCPIIGHDCAHCVPAKRALEQATEKYLQRNKVVIPNYTVSQSISTKDGSGTLYSVWFQEVIAELAQGKLVVREPNL